MEYLYGLRIVPSGAPAYPAKKARDGGNMRRWSILLLLPLTAAAIYACGGTQTPSSASSADTCPLLDAGPPEVCPEGCYWAADTKECRKHSGVIMDDAKKADSGAPTSTPGS